MRLWVAEAERRLKELREGTVAEIPVEEVFRRARAAISWEGQKKPQAAIMVDVLGMANASSQKNLSTIYKNQQYVSILFFGFIGAQYSREKR